MNEKTTPEVFPTITVDTEYGKFVDNLDLDANKITEHLRNSGLTDEQILETNIHFRSKVVGKNNGCLRLGNYKRFTKKVNIFALEFISNNDIPKEVRKEKATDLINNTVVHELEHRIASFDKQQGKANRRYHRKETFNKRMLGTLGLASLVYYGGTKAYEHIVSTTPSLPIIIGASVIIFMSLNNAERRIFRRQHYLEYRNSPEEIRTHAAADNYEGSVVSLSLKNINSGNEPL